LILPPSSYHIVLDELDREGGLALLDGGQADLLAQTRLLEVRPEHDQWRLLPRGLVGSVRLGDVQVDVRPKEKVGLTQLLFLLGYAADPGFRPEDVAATPDADLWPALAESFIRLTRTALGPGVLQGYRTIEEALRTVRGRIRIGDQITRRPGRMIPIEVTHDEYTTDIPENQLLRTALRRMLAVPRLTEGAKASLGHLDGQLDGITVLPPKSPLPAWTASRLNGRYVPALRLAELILANLAVESGAGQLQTAAFVVNMADVYEAFVGTALREALAPYPGNTRTQYPTRLDEPDYPGRPGLPMYHSPRLIFDAKYKAADPRGQYPNADHYQMLAYATALQLNAAWLVYAGPGTPRARRIVHTDKTIIEYPLDLDTEPSELLARVASLAEAAWAHSLVLNPAGA
jgi:5-methylcytosine-specific restriction enzyme subunit McrC